MIYDIDILKRYVSSLLKGKFENGFQRSPYERAHRLLEYKVLAYDCRNLGLKRSSSTALRSLQLKINVKAT